MQDIVDLMTWERGSKKTTPFNRERMMQELKVMQESNGTEMIYPFVSCSTLHPWLDSCQMVQLDRFWDVRAL